MAVELSVRRLLGAVLLAAALAGCRGTPRGETVGGAVAAPERLAAAAGAEVLADGGNAFDAAVCVGFVIAVTHPEAGNLGGGGFLVLHDVAQGASVIDCRERAPGRASRGMYLDAQGEPSPDASLVGPLAAGVPGSVDGYLELHRRHGSLPLARLIDPAIRLAEEGFPVDEGLAASITRARDVLARFPETAGIFLPDGAPPAVGSILRQLQLARVLRAIRDEGRAGFHAGWFAGEVERACAEHGGMLDRIDLASYRSVVRPVLRRPWREFEILTMPPPSSGGVVLLQILGMVERGGWEGLDDAGRAHRFVEASRRAFADRAVWFGDPDFVDVPVDALVDPAYLDRRSADIDAERATPSAAVAAGLLPREGEQTCHFSVIDHAGNAVSCTTSLNGAYGCGLSVHGVLLNNTMDDFTAKPGVPNQFGLIQGERNAIEPRKRPLSSMTPTIVLRDGVPVLAVGSPGGPTIISTVAQVVLQCFAAGRDTAGAVAAPRLHHQWQPDEILCEPLVPAGLRAALEARGHAIRMRERGLGDVQAVGRRADGVLDPVSDPRGRGDVALVGSGAGPVRRDGEQ